MCGSRFHSYCCPGWKTLPGGNQCIVRKFLAPFSPDFSVHCQNMLTDKNALLLSSNLQEFLWRWLLFQAQHVHLFQWAALPQLWLRSRSVAPPPPRYWHLLSVRAAVDARWGWSRGLIPHVANSRLNSKLPPLNEAVSRAFTFVFTSKRVDLPALALPVVSFTFLYG